MYKGNGEVSKELMLIFFLKTLFFFCYTLSYSDQNGGIPIVKEPYKLELQNYRMDQGQIVALRLPNMGLKVSFG